ncbi:DUF1236 domain-containing protein [Falsirhodobacter deserti]|uniref:DUF1236 domain-containing protein n=1 Tax=Falsirhodobacter deserti TaxID=1365611 RepID=UPI000FE39BEC|nr:DUF1236 domain-containing protein [Falsirhodobacter deserti]
MTIKKICCGAIVSLVLSSAAGAQTTTVTTTTDTTAQSSAVGGGMGAAVGAVVGGPVGALVGAAVGGVGGAAADPGPQVTTYVKTNPVQPVQLTGDLVVGAGIPQNVVLTPVPESEFSYAYVNGVPVIVEPQQRTIVQIVQ